MWLLIHPFALKKSTKISKRKKEILTKVKVYKEVTRKREWYQTDVGIWYRLVFAIKKMEKAAVKWHLLVSCGLLGSRVELCHYQVSGLKQTQRKKAER